ncbi:MAG: SulP family inorganic anion transporter [Chloroflexi bacterium]|nr:SulP family inorganic anion transporter [Chloroflexota bacterium]
MRALRTLLPTRADYAGGRDTWRADLLAGITVGVVALPLALGFGVATGLGAEAGLVTAIVAGFVAAVFGGSDVQVSGPTGAMTVVLVPIIGRHGPDAVIWVGILAGLLVLAAAVLRLGRYLAYLPWPVIEGFTLGIAIIIFLQQVPLALGVSVAGHENVLLTAIDALAAATADSIPSLAVCGLVAIVMLTLPRWAPRLPASLIGVIVATLVATFLSLSVATIGVLPSALPMPSLPPIDGTAWGPLLSAAIAVALLAALESLLSARVADGMADGRRHDPDRELLGQGLANVAAPLFGGMPATGAIARTAVNVRAGARTRLASVIHAVVLLGVVMLLAGPVGAIPLAALAGVLMVTATRMVDRASVRAVLRSTRGDALILVVTAAVTVMFDLILAVEVGVVVAALLALRAVARSSAFVPEDVPDVEPLEAGQEAELLHERILAYRLDGALFFGAAQRFLTELTSVSDVRVVILRMPQLQVLDATGAQALGQLITDLEARRITVLLKGAHPEHLRILRAVGALDRLRHERHIFASLDDAIAHARTHATAPATAGG